MLFAVYRPIPLSIETSALIGDTRHSRIIAYQSMPAHFVQLGGNLGGNFDPRDVRRTAGPRRANGVAHANCGCHSTHGKRVSLRLREDPQARDEIVNCLGSLRATDDLIIAAQGKGAAARISVDGPEILLSPKLALTMALLFHELVTNAAKYGALSQSVGKISVRWSRSDPWLNLEWRESEGPPVTVPSHRGFGTRLFLRALEQFGGKVEATFASTGLVCNLSVPLSELPSSAVPSTSDASAVLAADRRPKII
jgi:hypothetical protein